MKFYEKPNAELIKFEVGNSIMDGDAGNGPDSISETVGDSPFG